VSYNSCRLPLLYQQEFPFGKLKDRDSAVDGVQVGRIVAFCLCAMSESTSLAAARLPGVSLCRTACCSPSMEVFYG
jgi:hypothetical protein